MTPGRVVHPILEREVELAHLGQALETAGRGQGALVFISGEAGIGKSSLLREFAQRRGPSRMLIGICDPLDTPSPLGPLFDVAGELGAEVEQRLQGRATTPEVFRSVASALATSRRPLILAFEDIHWADQATLDLLRLIGRRANRLPALLLATLREEDAAAEGLLSLLLGDLTTSPGVQRLALAPLTLQATCQLASGSHVDAGALFELTGGNPFFITEALAAGRPSSSAARPPSLPWKSRATA